MNSADEQGFSNLDTLLVREYVPVSLEEIGVIRNIFPLREREGPPLISAQYRKDR